MYFMRSSACAILYKHICRFQKSSQNYMQIVDLVKARTVCSPHWHILPRYWWYIITHQSDVTRRGILGGIFIFLMSASIIRPYRATRWFIMYFRNDAINPVKKFLSAKMYIPFTALITIVFRYESILWWYLCTWQAYACSSRRCNHTSVVSFGGTVDVPPVSTGAL